jgi:hypothetical protein
MDKPKKILNGTLKKFCSIESKTADRAKIVERKSNDLEPRVVSPKRSGQKARSCGAACHV